MKVETKKLPHSQVELTVELGENELEPHYKKAAEKLSHAKPTKGFRPGTAPQGVVEKSFGKERLFHEAADSAVKESYVKAVLQEKIQPVAEPTIEIVPAPPDGGLHYKAILSVLPKFAVADWRKIKVNKEPVEVEQKEIARALETLQKSRAVYATVSRSAQKGDRVEVDFRSSVGGVLLEEGESKQHPLIVGEGHFIEGFEDEIVGIKEGETKEFSLRAPKNYPRAHLAGKKIDFSVTMRLIQSVELPPLDDEFAKRIGKLSSLEELKKNIGEGLLEEKKTRGREKLRVKMVEELLEKTLDFEIPEVLLEQEIVKMENELSASLARMGLDQASYLAHIKKSREDLRKDWRPKAEKRVKAALVLSNIAQQEGIIPDKKEVEKRIAELISKAPPVEIEKIDLAHLRGTVEGLVRNERVFKLLESGMVDPVEQLREDASPVARKDKTEN